jgi:hypothetical protein
MVLAALDLRPQAENFTSSEHTYKTTIVHPRFLECFLRPPGPSRPQQSHVSWVRHFGGRVFRCCRPCRCLLLDCAGSSTGNTAIAYGWTAVEAPTKIDVRDYIDTELGLLYTRVPGKPGPPENRVRVSPGPGEAGYPGVRPAGPRKTLADMRHIQDTGI